MTVRWEQPLGPNWSKYLGCEWRRFWDSDGIDTLEMRPLPQHLDQLIDSMNVKRGVRATAWSEQLEKAEPQPLNEDEVKLFRSMVGSRAMARS
jgi:hypothetical protein